MAPPEKDDEEYAGYDPLEGATEGDGTADEYRTASDAVDETLGLEEADEEAKGDDYPRGAGNALP